MTIPSYLNFIDLIGEIRFLWESRKKHKTLKCKNIFNMRYNILGHLIGEIKKNALSTGLFSYLTLSEQYQILVQTQRKKEQGQNLLFSMI